MIPHAALIILIIVVAVATITFLIAIYNTISSHFETSKDRDKEKDMSPSLTEAAAPTILPPQHSITPEAEFPPPLDDEGLVVAESPPPIPPTLPANRDSVHEVIDLYTNEGRSLPHSAPANIISFARQNRSGHIFGAKRTHQSNMA